MKKTSLIATVFLFMFVAFQNCTSQTSPERTAAINAGLAAKLSELAASAQQAPQNQSLRAPANSAPQ